MNDELNKIILYTIGHSNHGLTKFLQLLEKFGIKLLVDVRSAPYSRYNFHFNKEELERALSLQNIQYTYSGKHLGGRPTEPSLYKSHILPGEDTDYLHEVDYAEVMTRNWFIRGIDNLLGMAAKQTTVVMCSEEDPANCHRHHLIAKFILTEHPEVDIRHIRGDGVEYGAKSILASVDKSSAEQLPLF